MDHDHQNSGERQEALLTEIQDEIESRSRLLLAAVRGQLFWLKSAETNLNLSAVAWVLRAQEGTLDKLLRVFPSMDLKRGVELVALARNLFENLIWLKLFNLRPEYGLLFYRHLLESQIKSQEQAISQAETEISIFERAGKKDEIDFGPIDHIIKKDDLTKEEMALVQAHIAASAKRVDDEVRRSFSVYAHQAKTNGYEYQAYLLMHKVIPEHKTRKKINQDHLDELTSALPAKVSASLLTEFNARWNWAQRAQTVGMDAHYRFIYSYTSRLLHSTPMNIITPKDLDDTEREVLLDYIRTGVLDAHAAIEQFTYPGQIKALLVDVGQ